jgi:hypothetical protein
MKHAKLGALDVGRIGLGTMGCPTPIPEPESTKGVDRDETRVTGHRKAQPRYVLRQAHLGK